MNGRQKEISAAFDQIYRNRSFGYLRPSEAYEIFVTILSPKRGKKFLDVGSGLGLLLKLMVKKGLEAYGVDISEEAVHRSRTYCPEATVLSANAENLPFDDNTFDYVSCIGSLERMIDRKKAIMEQKRVAKEGARFCFMVRNSNHISWRLVLRPFRLFNRKAHQDALSLSEWTELFTSCGLCIVAMYPDHWPYYRWRKYFSLIGGRTDYSKIRNFKVDEAHAYEFIFLLEKNERSSQII